MKKVIQAILELIKIHEGLLSLSKEKTETIKEGSVEKIQNLLVRERKLVRQAEKIENERQNLVDIWCKQYNFRSEEMTVTNILEALEDEEEKQNLEEVTVQLTHIITDLKAQEKLNHGLIKQSIQFIDLSLDLLSPSLKNMNYGNKVQTEQPRHSVFDSKA